METGTLPRTFPRPENFTLPPTPCPGSAFLTSGPEEGRQRGTGILILDSVPDTALSGLKCHQVQVTQQASVCSGVKGGGELAEGTLVMSADLAEAQILAPVLPV